MKRFIVGCFVAACILFSIVPAWAIGADSKHPNVLFIAVDDLRPELNCYGQTYIHSPHIDKLAATGVVFERAYCMVPTCGASRASLMTGIRPTKTRFINYLAWAEKDAPGITTLNTHFKNNGYYTISNGKVFHHWDDCLEGWSERPWRPSAASYQLPESQRIKTMQAKQPRRRKRGPAFEHADAPDANYSDAHIAAKAISDLRRLKETQQPFFLAVGFFKPHLPFVAPQKYWNLYDHDRIRLPENYKVPQDAPKAAIHNFGELRAYYNIPAKGPLSDEMARNLIHGYYACVSFVDAQIGGVLDELDRLGLADNTIVVLWGDHGWNLGDHTLWCKHCCFESSMHAPLIVRVPGVPGGVSTRGLTEFIDIYPSLCELTGLPLPDHLQGKSFVPLLHEPNMRWKAAAIGRFQSGDTIRTEQYRFSEYTSGNGKMFARMLYDHQADSLENVNVSERNENADRVRQITDALHKGMGHSRKATR